MLMTALTVTALATVTACGGAPLAGPSPLSEAPPAGTLVAGHPFPAGLDPAYVRRLVYVVLNDDGTEYEHPLERWQGGAYVFCGGDPAQMAYVLERVRAATGLPGSLGEQGCNVRWVPQSGQGHTATRRVFSGSAILSAELLLYPTATTADVLHELGHVLGLGHSPRKGDLMYATPTADSFSADELAVLAWMYR